MDTKTSHNDAAEFTIVYDGPALSDHSIDVRDLAPALLALNELAEEANKTSTSGAVPVSVRVRSDFEGGCFQAHLFLTEAYSQCRSFFSGADATAWANVIQILGLTGVVGLLQLLKKLKGRRPTRVIELKETHTHTTRLEVDGETIDVNAAVWKLFENLRARKATEALLSPLQNEGVDKFKVLHKDKATFETDKSELPYYKAPDTSSDETRSETTVKLRVVSPSFRPENKWRVWDGASTIWVGVEDSSFQRKVQEGTEAFRKNDLLEAVLRTRQWVENGEIKVERTIVRVLSHTNAPAQVVMPDLLPPTVE